MDLGINWYQTVSVENIGVGIILTICLLILIFVFAKRRISRFIGVVISLVYLTLSLESSASIGQENVQFLHDRVADLQQSSEPFPLPMREEVAYLSNEILKAQEDGLYYVGNLERSHQALAFIHFNFMTQEETFVYKKFLSHCYSEDIVSTVWSEKLSGYPIHPDEARQALTYAEARSKDIKPECLGTTASLSFLK